MAEVNAPASAYRVRIRSSPRRIGMNNGSDYDFIIIGSGAGK
jgi:hypothetical protein